MKNICTIKLFALSLQRNKNKVKPYKILNTMKNTLIYSVNNGILMISTPDSCELIPIPNPAAMAREVEYLKEMGFVEGVNVHA